MDKQEKNSNGDQPPDKTHEPLFQWEYPDAVKALEKIHPSDLSEMIIAEIVRRLPVVAKHLAGAEESKRLALTSCTSPDDCFLGVRAREMEEGAAVHMIATMECCDMDVYRHWEYTNYSAVFADGSILKNCVPVGQSLAAVLPSFPAPPVLIIETEHLSGPSEIVDHEYMQTEHITFYSIAKPLAGNKTRIAEKEGMKT